MADPTVPAALRALLVPSVAVWLVCEVRQGRTRRAEGVSVDAGSLQFIRTSYVFGLLVGIACLRLVPGAVIHPRPATAWVGLVVLWAGIGLRLWSFQTLGRYFTFTVQTSDDQPVITAGPYSVIRHPGYAGVLVAVLGVSLVLGNWLTLVALTASMVIGLVHRIGVEDRALSRDLGEPYVAYAATHKRLLPGIW